MKRPQMFLILTLAIAIAALVAACGGESSTPTPAPTPTSPPPTPTATVATTPTATPEPTPTATPISAPDPGPSSLSPDATVRDLTDAFLSEAEVDCVRGAIGDALFQSILDSPMSSLEDPAAGPILSSCLAPETAAAVFVAVMSAGTTGLTDEGAACLRTGLAASGADLFADPPDNAVLAVMLGCLSEEELEALAPAEGTDAGQEFTDVDVLAQMRAMADTDPEVAAMLDCLDSLATQEQLEEYFAAGDPEILPPEALGCFPTVEGEDTSP